MVIEYPSRLNKCIHRYIYIEIEIGIYITKKKICHRREKNQARNEKPNDS